MDLAERRKAVRQLDEGSDNLSANSRGGPWVDGLGGWVGVWVCGRGRAVLAWESLASVACPWWRVTGLYLFAAISLRFSLPFLFRCPILSTLFKHKHGPNQCDDERKRCGPKGWKKGVTMERGGGSWRTAERGRENVMPGQMLQMVENAWNRHLNVVRFVQIKINGARTCDQPEDSEWSGQRTQSLVVWGSGEHGLSFLICLPSYGKDNQSTNYNNGITKGSQM